MNDAKYIGLEVHQATISASVLDSTGKLVMESVLERISAELRVVLGRWAQTSVLVERSRRLQPTSGP